MKEYLHTIPVNDGFLSGDECPFCFMERQLEQSAIRYAIGPGASYMEPDVRASMDRAGFCGVHMKKMYDYGNALGNALIMQTYYLSLFEELEREMQRFEAPPKKPLFGKRPEREESSLITWAREKQSTCFICEKIEYNMSRYYMTFFTMLKDKEFRSRVEGCKGFCMRHFLRLMEEAEQQLPEAQKAWFYPTVFRLMRENLSRVKGDLDWFVEKFDYRNASADWKNSRDAVSRSMQKLTGIHPADPVYKSEPR